MLTKAEQEIIITKYMQENRQAERTAICGNGNKIKKRKGEKIEIQ